MVKFEWQKTSWIKWFDCLKKWCTTEVCTTLDHDVYRYCGVSCLKGGAKFVEVIILPYAEYFGHSNGAFGFFWSLKITKYQCLKEPLQLTDKSKLGKIDLYVGGDPKEGLKGALKGPGLCLEVLKLTLTWPHDRKML